MNLFDQLQQSTFNVVTNTMGYAAVWIPSVGGAAKTAQVLYNGPSDNEKVLDATFSPDTAFMEYKKGDLDGLKEATDNNNFESIQITGIGKFVVKSFDLKYDGKTLKAWLEKIED